MNRTLNFDLNKFLMVLVAVVGLMSSSFFRTTNGTQQLSSEEKVQMGISLDEAVKNICENKYHLLTHKKHGTKLLK